MNLNQYQHTEFTHKPNKMQIMPVEFSFDQREEFNEIYRFVKEKFMKVEPTKSNSMPCNGRYKLHSRYMIVESHTSIELTVVSHLGCYRFLIGNIRDGNKNPVSGKQSVRTIYKAAKALGLDLSKYESEKEEGLKLKSEIRPPHIEMYGVENRVYTNVHHLDLNSSYASRISEAYPELRPLYKTMYDKRHERDNYYKHVLTNSIGCWQSQYCPDFNDKGKIAPYQFARLSKIAVNGTRELIERYVEQLWKTGRKVLLTNTDGIWYQGELYHDSRENTDLGGWKSDHKNCTFIMKSKGAYQYIEDGKCHTVVRGLTLLDRAKPREEWEFGEISNDLEIEYYEFEENIGVMKHVTKI